MIELTLAAFAHALCCTSQLLPRAAPKLTKSDPSTTKPFPPVTTGGGAPPSAPLNVCRFCPVDCVAPVEVADAEPTAAVPSETAVASLDAPPLIAALKASAAACPVSPFEAC